MSSQYRFAALQVATQRQVQPTDRAPRLPEIFASRVFTREKMQQYISADAFSALENLQAGATIDRKLADEVASGMKTWALEQGVSHYTHWFQPLNGLTAEKHDAFLSMHNGRPLETFSGGELSQQEPDASSFPSGGIRATFEARGYTAWDASSPAFIVGTTLCIPSLFFSYNGESLDFKGPLLRTIAELDKAATAVCEYFERGVTRVSVTLGPEQEYFLVDAALANARPDLVMAGRTVYGSAPARGQQLEDHYFGSISPRVHAFMVDLETEALMLGIPVKTRHNEVAPGQFECAPFFEELNLAVDHNQLLMDVMERVARKHNFRVLLHEKPFAGINGSGKHNNWSLVTNTGRNLLSPGKTTKENLQFLTFLVCTLKAIHTHADLLRASIASAGNDFRLGANEAPPAIISVFLGTEVSKALDELENTSVTQRIHPKSPIQLGISRLPQLFKDNTDRNRTSPFAFTGNKFEFRAVGSSANVSAPMIVLNTIVTAQLKEFKQAVDARVAKGEAKEVALVEVVRQYAKESRAIRFEGNGYSDEWKKEAKKRGLSNIPTTPEALDAFLAPASVKVFSENGIISERELHARYEIRMETYIKRVEIESLLMEELAHSHIIPAALEYQKKLTEVAEAMKDIDMPEATYAPHIEMLKAISGHVTTIQQGVAAMAQAREALARQEDIRKKGVGYCEKVFKHFEPVREAADALERMVDDGLWPLPKYREMLFVR